MRAGWCGGAVTKCALLWRWRDAEVLWYRESVVRTFAVLLGVVFCSASSAAEQRMSWERGECPLVVVLSC